MYCIVYENNLKSRLDRYAFVDLVKLHHTQTDNQNQYIQKLIDLPFGVYLFTNGSVGILIKHLQATDF